MRPLKEFSNQEKAKFLHEFLPHDIKALLSCIEHTAAYILKNKREIKRQWKSKTIAVEEWYKLADEAYLKIKEHRPQLTADSQLFANELFSGYMGIFSLHCIKEYIELSHNQRLLDAVKFFFDLKPRKQIPGTREEER